MDCGQRRSGRISWRLEPIDGHVTRTGDRDTLNEIYFCDPGGNLIEMANELQPAN